MSLYRTVRGQGTITNSKGDSVRDANSKNRPKMMNADTRFRAKNLSRPREEVKLHARQFSDRARTFQARTKFDTRDLISRETKQITRHVEQQASDIKHV